MYFSNYVIMKLLQFGESQMKCTCFLSLVNYIIRDIVTALLLMNVFCSCSPIEGLWNNILRVYKLIIRLKILIYNKRFLISILPFHNIFTWKFISVLYDYF